VDEVEYRAASRSLHGGFAMDEAAHETRGDVALRGTARTGARAALRFQMKPAPRLAAASAPYHRSITRRSLTTSTRIC
jgi:hypothetical protein